jgi:hypothetical protein
MTACCTSGRRVSASLEWINVYNEVDIDALEVRQAIDESWLLREERVLGTFLN